MKVLTRLKIGERLRALIFPEMLKVGRKHKRISGNAERDPGHG